MSGENGAATALATTMATATATHVHYGAGWCAPVRWRNFDASPTLRFERLPIIGRLYTKNAARFPANVEYGDIVAGLPVADGSCAAVYCSHVLEHLALADFRTALVNTRRLLRPGGVFRLVMPDLEICARRYLANGSADAAFEFFRDSGLGADERRRRPGGLIRDFFGNSRHLWLWDYKSAARELERAGFAGIRRAAFGDGADPLFREVEDYDRWKDCLGIECRR